MLHILLLLVDNKLEGNIVVVFGDGVGNGTWLLLLLLLLLQLMLLLLRLLFTTPLVPSNAVGGRLDCDVG